MQHPVPFMLQCSQTYSFAGQQTQCSGKKMNRDGCGINRKAATELEYDLWGFFSPIYSVKVY